MSRKWFHQLLVARVARYVLQHRGETMAVRIPSRPENTVCVHGHGLGSGRADRLFHALLRGMAVTCFTAASRSNRWLHCAPRGRVLRHCQGRGDIEANIADLGTDRDAIGGDHCIQTAAGFPEGATTSDQKSCGYRNRTERKSSSWCRSTLCWTGRTLERKHTRLRRLRSLPRQMPLR